MLKDLAYRQLKENFAEELKVHPDWSVSDLLCWIMSEIATTVNFSFKERFSTDDLEILRVKLIQLVDLVVRFATVSPNASNIQNRSNIHAILHLYDCAVEFGTLVNICCSPGMGMTSLSHVLTCSTGEAKHKPFKEMARQSNKKDVPRQMLSKVMLTFRLL